MNSTPNTAEQSAAIEKMSETVATLEKQNKQLLHQVEWFKRQLFGEKSEKRHLDESVAQQLTIGSLLGNKLPVPNDQLKEAISYTRNKNTKNRLDGSPDDTGLRFDESVPVKKITLACPELEGDQAHLYEIIGEKTTYRLAQQPCANVILKFIRPVVKHRDSGKLISVPAPPAVIEKSYADVSFIVGMLIDKFAYHQPLYRQHQRLGHNGIVLSRTTLTCVSNRAMALLKPIVDAQLVNVLRSHTLAMDETPTKAGRKKQGKMKKAWYWPVYGDQDEVVFIYSPSRATKVVQDHLKGFSGTLLTDGYSAYTRYCNSVTGVTHALCWVHTRRYFDKALNSAPKESNQALDIIGALYRIERQIKDKSLEPDKALAYRAEHAHPIVEQFFAWCKAQLHALDTDNDDPLAIALNYAITREVGLRVYLSDPHVPMDTNHVERALRPIPLGKKNWLFSWTEVGADYVGVIQSLIITCRLHDVNPYTYLVDVLQRIDSHPASKIEQLTPRMWKTLFANNPLKSYLDY